MHAETPEECYSRTWINVGIECGLVRYAYQVATRTDGEKAFETCTIHIYANVLPQETLTPIVRRKQAK